MSDYITDFNHSTARAYICMYRKSKLDVHIIAALKADYGFTIFAAIEFGFYNDIFHLIRNFNRDNPKEDESETFYDDDGTVILKIAA